MEPLLNFFFIILIKKEIIVMDNKNMFSKSFFQVMQVGAIKSAVFECFWSLIDLALTESISACCVKGPDPAGIIYILIYIHVLPQSILANVRSNR